MSEEAHKSHFKEYILVFILLAVLTFVELFVPAMDATIMVKGAILTFIASVKAFAVAYWYMHLKDESKWMKIIAAVPISAGIYALVVCLESVYR